MELVCLDSFVLQEEAWENADGNTQFLWTILGNISDLLSEGNDFAIDYSSRMVNGFIHSIPSVGIE